MAIEPNRHVPASGRAGAILERLLAYLSPGGGRVVHFEQAVYGSFPFWHRGYAVLARSAGCRPEWIEALRVACQRLGEPPSGIDHAGFLFAARIPRGPWMVVGAYPVGRDDRGRPGAHAFHALFVARSAYAAAGDSPFALAVAHRRDWDDLDEDAILPEGRLVVIRDAGAVPEPGTAVDPRAGMIATSLVEGRRVRIQAGMPVPHLAAEVWRLLPARVRRRASLATWAFDGTNPNAFDLAAFPRLTGHVSDRSVLVLTEEPAVMRTGGPEPGPSGGSLDSASTLAGPGPNLAVSPPGPGRRRTRIAMPLVLGLAATVMLGMALALTRSSLFQGGPELASAPVDPGNERPPREPGKIEPRFATPIDERPASEDELRRLLEALVDVRERFLPRPEDRHPPETAHLGGPNAREVVGLMTDLATRLRYAGPILSGQEVAALGRTQQAAPGAPSAVVRWDGLIRRYLADRPLPAGFEQASIRRQLALLCWSFHVEDDPGVREALTRGEPAEVVHALADALSVDVPLAASSLAEDFPPLEHYRRFLERLPRR